MINLYTKKHAAIKSIQTLSIVTLSLTFGCGSSSSSSGSKAFTFPAVAPIVASATPAGLKSTSTSSIQLHQIFNRIMRITFYQSAMAAAASVTNVTTSLTGMFKGTFGKISGGQGTGYIN